MFCEGCPYKTARVGTKGPEDSPVIVVGESPGNQEVIKGVPFIGPSGAVIDDAIHRACKVLDIDLTPERLYWTNAFHCLPNKTKDEVSTNTAAQACRGRLLQEINSYPRKLLLALGNPAIRSVTGDYSLKITAQRGKLLIPAGDIQNVQHTLAAVHPAFVLRGGGNYRQFKDDIVYGLQLATGAEAKTNPDVEWLVCDTPQLLWRLYTYLQRQPAGTLTAADLETGSPPSNPEGNGGFNHIDDSVLMLGLCTRPDAVYIIPEEMMRHTISRQIFRLNNLQWAWHNGKFDVKWLWRLGIPEARVDEDTMLMSYTLDERGGVHDLEEVAHDRLGSPRWKHILDQHKKKQQSYRVIPRPILYKYAAYDISNTYRLVTTLRPLIDGDPNNAKLYRRVLLPASAYLAKMEDHGLGVDPERVAANSLELKGKITEYSQYIIDAANQFPNSGYSSKLCNSPKQLGKLLFEDLKLTPPKNAKTKTGGWSTDDDVLELLAESYPNHPVVKNLRLYRKVAKLESTYVRPLMDWTDEKGRLHRAKLCSDGRMHTTFKLHGTATGRLASGDPINLQNQPRDAQIRGQYVPRPGYVFIEPDLNQAELRSLADYSGDKRLTAIYTGQSNEGGVHDVMRRQMFGDPEDWGPDGIQHWMEKLFVRESNPDKYLKAVLDEQKMKAKNVNFGIVYGITEFGLAEQLECTLPEARAALKKWRETFPGAWEFIEACMAAPRKGLNLVTPFGNRKRHHIVTRENLHFLQKEAANFPHQATASHIMLQGGVETHERYAEQYRAYIVNTVHDSMLIECPNDPDTIRAICEDITSTLEAIPPKWGITRIPFVADAKIGPRWGRAYMTEYPEWLKQQRSHQEQDNAEPRDERLRV